MTKPPFVIHSYPWYVRDWRGSRKRMRLSPLGRLAFRELLDECAIEGSIPDEPAVLANICALPLRDFAKVWPEVRACFELREDGNLHNAKVDSVLEDIIEWKQQRSNAGRASGQSRRTAAERKTNDRSTAVQQPMNGTSNLVEPSVAVAVAVPVPVPVAEPNGWDPQIAFEELAAAYPQHRSSRAHLAQQNYIAATGGLEEKHHRLLKLLGLCKDSEDWTKDDGQYVPGMAKWLSEPPWHLLKAHESAPKKRKPMVEMTVKELEAAGLLPWQ